jgi:hypothetical protein
MRLLTERRLFAALCVVIGLCIAIQAAFPLAILPLHVSWNNNEGWDAYWQARAVAGQPIYTDQASPLTNNYPPLSFFLVGWLGNAIGDMVVAGRLLGLMAMLACVACVKRVVDRFGAAPRWSWAAAGLFLVYIATYAPRYLVANDPQWLAQVPQALALLLLVRPGAALPGRGHLAGACALILLSGLMKHSQWALPLAVTLWLVLHDRRKAAFWILLSALAVALTTALLFALFGPALFDQLLHHQRVMRPERITLALRSLLPLVPQMIAALLLALRRRGATRDPRLTLLLLFALFAVPIGAFQRLGVGVSLNAHFDAALALAIVAGIALGAMTGAALRLATLALMLVPLAIKTATKLPETLDRTVHVADTAARWRETVALLAAAPGPVICERPALCYWAGKPFTLDFSNYGQKLRKSGDPIDLRGRIGRGDYAAIVEIRNKDRGSDAMRLPPAYYDLIERRYRVAQTLPDEIYVLVPRG